MLKNKLIYKRNSKISKLSRVFALGKVTNSSINDYSYLNIFANVNNTEIGKFCSISMNFKSGLGKHPTKFMSTSPFFYSNRNALKDTISEKNIYEEYERIKIGNDVWIGADVIILDGITVGDGAVIASKAVVSKDVPDFAIVGGVPAKVLKYRFSEEIIDELKRIKWWNWSISKIKKNKNIFSQELDIKLLKKIVD